MVISSVVLGMLLLASPFSDVIVTARTIVPWDGRAFDLTVDTLPSKFSTDILTTRNDSANNDPANYVTIAPNGRSPVYNDDSGVIDIAVDDTAIFKNQTNARRSELAISIAADPEATTIFSASVMKKEAFLNPYVWQLIFPESHLFEIRVDATADPAKIIYLNNGTEDAKWEAEFVPGTWYNFEFGLSAKTANSTALEFYTSKGNDRPFLNATHTIATKLPSSYELHYGLLTLSDDGSDPKMDAKQDVVSFNGLSAEELVYGNDLIGNYPNYPDVDF